MNQNEQILQGLLTNLKSELTPNYDPSSSLWFFIFVFIVAIIVILCLLFFYKLSKKISYKQYKVKKQTIVLINSTMKNSTEKNKNPDNFLSFINISLKRMILTLDSNQALNLNGKKWVKFLLKQFNRNLNESECKAIDLLGNNSYKKIDLNQEQKNLIRRLAVEWVKKYSIQTNK